MKKSFALTAFLALACGSEDPAARYEVRDATSSECEFGGYVLVVDDGDFKSCNGAPGPEGAVGETGFGERGPAGEPGADGEDGVAGPSGSNGLPGVSGLNASVQAEAFISCVSEKRRSMVGIQCPGPEPETFGFGSGTVDEAGNVITALHVVSDAEGLPVAGCDIFDIDVDRLALVGSVSLSTPDATGLDITSLTIDWLGEPPIGLTRVVNPPSLGDFVASIGHPSALISINITSGFVTATGVQEFGEIWTDAFMGDYASSGGGSGAAIFNSDCEWIGVHVGGFEDGLEISIGLPF